METGLYKHITRSNERPHKRLCVTVSISSILFPVIEYYKKDGYRQQNVRQRQKLISIIDYDVCMTFY